MARKISDRQYRELLRFRDGLRAFLWWSGRRAEAEGLTPNQHQLLLVIRADADPGGPTIGEVAAHLLLRHHSAVELVDRAVAAGLIRRRTDAGDGRVVRLELSPLGKAKLEALTAQHLEELRRFAARLRPVWEGLEITDQTEEAARTPMR
jgi:DNA-binding MarR family transcriptional regulator